MEKANDLLVSLGRYLDSVDAATYEEFSSPDFISLIGVIVGFILGYIGREGR